MATNPTKDPMQYMEQQLKNAQIHLDAAHSRVKKAQEKQKKKKAEMLAKNKKYKRPDIPDTNSEIINLKIKIKNLEYCIACMKIVEENNIEVPNFPKPTISDTVRCKRTKDLRNVLRSFDPETLLTDEVLVREDGKKCKVALAPTQGEIHERIARVRDKL